MYKDLSLYKFTLERIVCPCALQNMKLKLMPGFRLKWRYEDDKVDHLVPVTLIQPEPRYTSRTRTKNLIKYSK